jgi:hypothetical protein
MGYNSEHEMLLIEESPWEVNPSLEYKVGLLRIPCSCYVWPIHRILIKENILIGWQNWLGLTSIERSNEDKSEGDVTRFCS